MIPKVCNEWRTFVQTSPKKCNINQGEYWLGQLLEKIQPWNSGCLNFVCKVLKSRSEIYYRVNTMYNLTELVIVTGETTECTVWERGGRGGEIPYAITFWRPWLTEFTPPSPTPFPNFTHLFGRILIHPYTFLLPNSPSLSSPIRLTYCPPPNPRRQW